MQTAGSGEAASAGRVVLGTKADVAVRPQAREVAAEAVLRRGRDAAVRRQARDDMTGAADPGDRAGEIRV